MSGSRELGLEINRPGLDASELSLRQGLCGYAGGKAALECGDLSPLCYALVSKLVCDLWMADRDYESGNKLPHSINIERELILKGGGKAALECGDLSPLCSAPWDQKFVCDLWVADRDNESGNKLPHSINW